jgi:hypothetical protein
VSPSAEPDARGEVAGGDPEPCLGDEQRHGPADVALFRVDQGAVLGLVALERPRVVGGVGAEIGPDAGWAALDAWRRLGMIRYPLVGILGRVWQLRDNLSAYDACYVALAEQLGCALLTADQRLACAPGTRCPITVVPR